MARSERDLKAAGVMTREVSVGGVIVQWAADAAVLNLAICLVEHIADGVDIGIRMRRHPCRQ